MLKCGQKDNKNYTFGVRKEQIEGQEKEANRICCASCFGCSYPNWSSWIFCFLERG